MQLKDVNNLEPVEIKFDESDEKKEFGNAFEDYFHNSDEKVCPIKSCRLLS